MYVWTVELEEKWDDDKYFSDGGAEYVVAANSYESALDKAKKAALKKNFVDEDKVPHRVTDSRLISISRGAKLDA